MPVKKTTTRSKKTPPAGRRRAAGKPAAKNRTTANRKAGAANYRFNSVLAINNLGALREDLNRLVEQDADVQLDASAVELIDTASIQLILTFVIELRNRNRNLSWQAASEKLVASVALLGLAGALGIH